LKTAFEEYSKVKEKDSNSIKLIYADEAFVVNAFGAALAMCVSRTGFFNVSQPFESAQGVGLDVPEELYLTALDIAGASRPSKSDQAKQLYNDTVSASKYERPILFLPDGKCQINALGAALAMFVSKTGPFEMSGEFASAAQRPIPTIGKSIHAQP
jgi:hypothetical protein